MVRHQNPECDGVVRELRGLLVLFTGKTRIDGQHVQRRDLERMVRARGADVVPDGSRNTRVDLLVQGDAGTGWVQDPVNVRSKKAVFVDKQRRAGNHICIVDDNGLAALLDGNQAQCLRSTRLVGDIVELAPPRATQPQFIPLVAPRAPHHEPIGLTLDLSGLDRGTVAHEMTIRMLVDKLAPATVGSLSAPKVDAAWMLSASAGVLAVAEVKSLTAANDDQQIRLGIGQILDYRQQVRMTPPEGIADVVAVVALEREPSDVDRWRGVAESVGIIITWAPDFPEIPR